LKHAWEHTIGSGHAPLALRADWQAQLRRCHDELGFRYVRFHGLLSDDMGTLIAHDDKPLSSFFNADRICDFLVSIGMRPFVELSFMPKMLAPGMAQAFARLGAEVFLVSDEAEILPREDRDAAALVEAAMLRDGVIFLDHGKQFHLARNPNGGRLQMDVTGPSYDVVVDQLLVAVGRAPNVEGLGLETVGVKSTIRL